MFREEPRFISVPEKGGKRGRENWCAGCFPSLRSMKSVPVVRVTVLGRSVWGLLDSGSTESVILKSVWGTSYGSSSLITADGSSGWKCFGMSRVPITIGKNVFNVECTVVDRILGDFGIILGYDAIVGVLGGLDLTPRVQNLGETTCPPSKF